ncbi:MAG: STAS domain-containing protein [Betaproteobacteria bacterium]
MNVHERDVTGITVLAIEGRIDSTTAAAFGARIEAAVDGPQRRVLLDVGDLEYISSAGFRVLYLAAKRAGETGAKLVICCMPERVRELFSIAGFLKFFTVAGTQEEGVAALK